MHRDITFSVKRKTVKFCGIWRKKAEFHLLRIFFKKSLIFKNYSKIIDKICVHELYKLPLSLSVSDSKLSVELLGSLSELKSVLEVAELSVNLDSEGFTIWIWHFGGKIRDFLDPDFDHIPYTTNGERKAIFNVYFNWNFIFEKLGGHNTANLHTW